MKKTVLFLIFLIWTYNSSFAQTYQIKENNYQHIAVSFTSSLPEVQIIKNSNGIFTRLVMEDCTPSQEVGKPELPIITKLIEIPMCNDVIISINGSKYKEYDAAAIGFEGDLYPVQQHYPKSYTGPISFDKDETVYRTNAFYSLPLATIEKIGVMRDINMASIAISPISYNPVTHKVRVYSYIDVDVSFINANVSATRQMQSKYGSPLFTAAHQSVINPMNNERSEFENSPIKYLIVAHSMFENNTDLQTFINWKKRMGYLVEIAYTGTPEVGTTETSIKNFVKSHYTNATTANPAPTYLLLIGDVQQIPSHPSSDYITDSYYVNWTNDYLPDCYCGRFSAQNISQLTPQIEKTLMYEQYTMPDPSYLGKACLIAGTDPNMAPTYGNGALHYVNNNYLNTNNGYSQVFVHPYNCSLQAVTIRNEIGAGVGWANYTAHGYEHGWADPSFTCSDVPNMNNENKYGIMIGNCCLSGKFDVNSCFGETLLRAENKGAMGYIGASTYSYWDEDYYWAVGARSYITANPTYDANHLGGYDRMFHTHNENHNDWYSTMGGLVHAGNLSVQSSSSYLKQYYWEVYHIFGDPSVRLYQSIPETMTVTASDVILIGSNSYSVTAVPYAYVALTHNNELIAAAFADENGNATLTFGQSIIPGEYELAISAQNYIQYFKTVNVIAPGGSYVVATDINMASTTPIPASTLQWNLTLKNLGVENATGVYAKISTDYAGVNITVDSIHVGNLAADSIINFNNAFSAIIPANAPDQSIIPFTVTVYFDGNSDSRNTDVIVMAPQMTITEFQAVGPENTTNLHAGNQVTAEFTNLNSGHYKFETGMAKLSSLYSGITILTEPQTFNNLECDQTVTTSFTIQVKAYVPEVTIIPLYYSIYNNGTLCQIDTFHITIGSTVETWESNDFNTFNWENDGIYPWTITSTETHNGNYSARSYPDLSYNKTSTLSITVTSIAEGIFSYYHKVSSENNYDVFTFSIDNDEKESLSGSKPWAKSEFFVPAGTHTYTFSYSKDWSYDYGSDCVWIDDITFPGLGTMANEEPFNLEPEIVSACESFTWNGEDYTESGTYTFLIESQSGDPDTLETLDLTINQPVHFEPEVVTACDSFSWHGQIYTESGTYTFIREGHEGECDTTETLQLTIHESSEPSEFAITTDNYYKWNGKIYTTSGDYTLNLSNMYGCDSIVTLHLTINPVTETTEFDATDCQTYTWNDQTYNESGDYEQTLSNSEGNDSIAILHLTINQPVFLEPEEITACVSFIWHDQTYLESGNYTFIRPGIDGECDTTETLNLTINQPSTFEFSESACATYTWNQETYTESGDYEQTFVNAVGCDSVATLHLIINQPSSSEFTVIECDSYTWNNETYTQSGDYEQTFENAVGCDSVVTLHLNIKLSTTSEFTASACETYTWNDETYTQSGDYEQIFENAVGCDSIVTLHLTINHVSHINLEKDACVTYTWNDETYTESGTYEQSFISAAGCDSIVTLHLNIWPLPDVEISAEQNSVYIGNSVTLTATGAEKYFWSTGTTTASINVTPQATTTYKVTGTDVHGCKNHASIEISVYGVGIDDYNEEFTVYPNPAITSVNISGYDMQTISLYDQTGRLLKVIHPDNENFAILKLSEYASGYYVVQIKLRTGNIIYKKIILER